MVEPNPISDNSIPANPANTVVTKIWQYVLDNPIKTAATTALAWGGLLMLMFFSRIGYMPDINLESATSLLYAIALLGSFVAAYTMLMMVMPGLLIATAKEPTERITFQHLLCITTGASLIWAAALLDIFDFMPSDWAWIAAAMVTLMAPGIGVFLSRKYPKLEEPVTVKMDAASRWSPQDQPVKIYFWSLGMVIALGALMTIPLLFISMIGLSGDIRTASSGQSVAVLIVLVLLITSSAALIGGVKTSHVAKVATIFAPLLLFVVLGATGSFSFFSVLAIKALGHGEISAARITVTGKTCQEINETLGQRICVAPRAESVTAICPVMIRSRIGSQVVLEFAPMGIEKSEAKKAAWIVSDGGHDGAPGEKTIRRVIIDKPKLLSWQPLKGFDERDQTQMINSTAPRVASWLEPKEVGDGKALNQVASSLSSALTKQCGAQPIVESKVP